MALTTDAQIKERITGSLSELLGNPYAEDVLAELADAEVPAYNNEVIQDWVQLPMDQSDQWKELGYDTQRNEGGILRLMAVDLAIYYSRKFAELWEEVKAENAN
jgi:hypothetical protein